MRKVTELCRRSLSAILAAAMVLTSAPGTTMTALAAEQTEGIEMTAGEEPGQTGDQDKPEGSGEEAQPEGADEVAGEENGENDENRGAQDEGNPVEALTEPAFTKKPTDGKLGYGSKGFFTLTIPDNSIVKYTVGTVQDPVPADPDAETGSVYSEDESVEVRAAGAEDGCIITVKAVALPVDSTTHSASKVVSETFDFAPNYTVLSAPDINLNKYQADNRAKNVTFTITNLPEVGVVKYTVDGNDDPATAWSAKEYTEGEVITVKAPDTDEEQSLTIYAVAVAPEETNYLNSGYVSATVTFAAKPEAVQLEHPMIHFQKDGNETDVTKGVKYGEAVDVVIDPVEGADIYYTLDGKDPTKASKKYEKPFALKTNKENGEMVEIRAIAIAQDTDKNKDSMVSQKMVELCAKQLTMTLESKNHEAFTVQVIQKIDYMYSASSVTVDENHQFTVSKGAWVQVIIRDAGGYRLTSVKDDKKSYSITVYPDNNLRESICTYSDIQEKRTIRVTTGAAYTLTVQNSKGGKVDSVDDTYQIDPLGEYTISVKKEDAETITVDSAVLCIGGETVTDENLVRTENGAVKFTAGKATYGKRVKIDLVVQDEVFATVNLKVGEVLTGVTVQGVNKNKELTVPLLLNKEYQVTYAQRNAADQLGVYVPENSAAGATVNPDGNLDVTAAMGAAKEPTKIYLYNKMLQQTTDDGETELLEQIQKPEILLDTITVKGAYPKWHGGALKISAVGSTERELQVSATTPNTAEVEHGNFFYVFHVTDVTDKNEKKELDPIVLDAYSGTEIYTLPVVTSPTEELTPKKYTVQAYLVGSFFESMPEDENDEDAALKTKVSNTINCSTKTAYFADKITLKKGKTTVYTGEEDVQIATIDYGKKTTYQNAVAMMCEVDGKTPRGFTPEVKGNKVYVTVQEDVKPGKYNVRVVAASPQETKAAEATISISVEKNIGRFLASCGGIYKQKNKAGKATINISYWDNSDYKPGNPKFTYTVGFVDSETGYFVSDPAVLRDAKGKNAVSVSKSGVVTISKDYVVKEDSEENEFYVLVKADDYKENPYTFRCLCRVKSERDELGSLVLLDEEGRVIAEQGTSGKPAMVDADLFMTEDPAVQVIALKKDAVKTQGGGYRISDRVNVKYDVTLKGKGAHIDKYDHLLLDQMSKQKVTITATTRDGGNAKVSLTVQFTYGKCENPGVVWSDGNSSTLSKLTTYDSKNPKETINMLAVDGKPLSSGSSIILYAMADQSTPEGIADRYKNCSINVSGGIHVLMDYGAAAAQDGAPYGKNQVLFVTLTGKEGTITLNADGRKIVYKISSERFIPKGPKAELAAPKITVPQDCKNQQLVVGKEMQTLTFQVDKKAKLPENAKAEMVLLDSSLQKSMFEGDLELSDNVEYDEETRRLTLSVPGVSAPMSGTVCFVFSGTDGKTTKISNGVKIKAVNMKKSFSLESRYKMSWTDATEVPLRYKGTNVKNVVVNTLFNENVNGQSNKVKENIAIANISDISSEYKFAFSLYGEPDTKLKKLNIFLKGYVEYEDGEHKEFEQKVTIEILPEGKTVKTYKAKDVSVNKNTDVKAVPVTVMVGNKELLFDGGYIVDLTAYRVSSEEETIPEIKTSIDTDKKKIMLDLSGVIDEWKKNGKQETVRLKIIKGTGSPIWVNVKIKVSKFN